VIRRGTGSGRIARREILACERTKCRWRAALPRGSRRRGGRRLHLRWPWDSERTICRDPSGLEDGGDHLLCVSGCDSYEVAPLQAKCRSAVIDPQTLELVQSFPGELWALRVIGDTAGRPRRLARGGRCSCNQGQGKCRTVVRFQLNCRRGGRVRATPRQPSQGEQKLTWLLPAREGEWLPSRMNYRRCDKFFHVVR